MPYRSGDNLPGEVASKLGHVDAIESEVVRELLESFETQEVPRIKDALPWEKIPIGKPIESVIATDGSVQPIPFEEWPYVKLSCVKVSMVTLESGVFSEIDSSSPHPLELRDILSRAVISHVNLFPLRHVRLRSGTTIYNAIRKITFDGMKKDPKLGGEVLETLKWLAFQKWDGKVNSQISFECPHCRQLLTFLTEFETNVCSNCGGDLLITDWLGFHQRMLEATDNVSEEVAKNYMNVYEVLLIFTRVRQLWQEQKEALSNHLFIKDGPLYLSDQFAHLVPKIRNFFSIARDEGNAVHMVGQEKQGMFFDHFELIGRDFPDGCVFVPSSKYVKEQIQQRPDIGSPYGKFTNFGAKVFVKLNSRDKFVLSIPTGDFVEDPTPKDLIGLDRIVATIPSIQSRKFEGALLPIEIAHGQASISNYPSVAILKDYAEKSGVVKRK